MKPATPAAAGALIAYIRSFIMDERDCGEWAMDDWTMPALKNGRGFTCRNRCMIERSKEAAVPAVPLAS